MCKRARIEKLTLQTKQESSLPIPSSGLLCCQNSCCVDWTGLKVYRHLIIFLFVLVSHEHSNWAGVDGVSHGHLRVWLYSLIANHMIYGILLRWEEVCMCPVKKKNLIKIYVMCNGTLD